MIARQDVLEEARAWLGTPYRHQASVKGVGCDCIGLVRGVWRALYGNEPEALPTYTPDWAERYGAEALYAAARRHMRWTTCTQARPGDVLLFRMDAHSPIKHAAILDEGAHLIHAYWARAVVRSRYASWWRTRCAAAFAFPGVAPWLN